MSPSGRCAGAAGAPSASEALAARAPPSAFVCSPFASAASARVWASRPARARLPHARAPGLGSEPQGERRSVSGAEASPSPLRSRGASARLPSRSPAQASATPVPVGPAKSVPAPLPARGRSTAFVLSPALLSSYTSLAPFPGPAAPPLEEASPSPAPPRVPPLRRPLRVAIFVEPSPFTYVSGYRNRYTNAIAHLKRLGCEVLVVTPGRPMCGPLGAGGRAARPQPAEYCGAKVHEVLSVGIPWWYPELPLSLGAGRRTKEVVRAFAPDLIHSTSPGLLTLGAWAHARSLDVPIVLAYHTHVPKYLPSYNAEHLGPLFWKLLRTFHGKAARTLVTSQPLADELHQQGVGRKEPEEEERGDGDAAADAAASRAAPLRAQGDRFEEDWFGAVADGKASPQSSPSSNLPTPSAPPRPRAARRPTKKSPSTFASFLSSLSTSSAAAAAGAPAPAPAPSSSTSTIEVWQRGVDSDLFSPAARSEAARDALFRGDAEALKAIGRAMEEEKDENAGPRQGDGPSPATSSVASSALPSASASGPLRPASRKKHLLLSVGRLGHEKNLSFLRPVLERLPDAHLAFVGDGPARAALEEEFAGLPVSFLGMQSGKALSAAYASADVFVMPSESETLGFVVLEAMASAVPPVAVRAGGIPDVVGDGEGTTAFLYEPGDVDGAVARVRALLDSPARREAMGRAARNEVSKWDWGAATAKLLSTVYLPVVEDARQRKGMESLVAPDVESEWEWGARNDAEWIMGGEGI